jgi:hypothetical protein
MRAVKVRILCNGHELAVGRFVGRFVSGVCRGIIEALKTSQPIRDIVFEIESSSVRLWVNGDPVLMDNGQGFARVIVEDTLRGMLTHLKGMNPEGITRIETTLEALQ